MGLGKTVQTLALAPAPARGAAHGGPVLLVCPTSVVGNWQREAARFTPDLPRAGPPRRPRGRAATAFAGRRGRARRSCSRATRCCTATSTHFGEVEWAGVILDEAQNIKNPETRQAQAARALHAGYRIALTGTPVENHVGDLWSHHRVPEPRPARQRRPSSSATFFVPIQAQPATRAAAARLQAAHRPVHPAPAEDRPAHHRRPAREAGDEGLLHADARAGDALRRGA